MHGICTLANDHVYDQLVALLNSIEAVLGTDMPVCVYPYDDNISQISAEIARRPNVQLYQDRASIQRWDQFFREAWATHPTATQRWQAIASPSYAKSGVHRFGAHRRMCAFDGPFDRFLYMDADTLLMGEVAEIFAQLDHADWVTYDFQHTDPGHVYNLASPQLATLFSPQQLETEMFCSGFYASKKNIFPAEMRHRLIAQLRQGEADVLYLMSADQPILNYMVMRSLLTVYNFAHHLPDSERTGCCVTSSHFEEREHVLFDRGHRLTYLHYIGLSANLFRQLCGGENITFPYRDLFLHYRYLRSPHDRPVFTTPPKAYNQAPSLTQRLLQKLKLA